MTKRAFKLGSGDPNESPFSGVAYQLAIDLPLSASDPIVFADFETTQDQAKSLQKEFWAFNSQHDLTWRFATRHFPSADGQFDIVRVWKQARD